MKQCKTVNAENQIFNFSQFLDFLILNKNPWGEIYWRVGLASAAGGGYFGLRSYGDVPTFRVEFLTQNILDRVQIWGSTKCWAENYFRPGRKLGFGHELLRKILLNRVIFLFISKNSLNIAWNMNKLTQEKHPRPWSGTEYHLDQATCQQHRILGLECPQENERVIVTEDFSD